MEFDELGEELWDLLRTWVKNVFHKECRAILDRYSIHPHLELNVLGRMMAAFEPDVDFVALNGGSRVLAGALSICLGSANCQKLVDYPILPSSV